MSDRTRNSSNERQPDRQDSRRTFLKRVGATALGATLLPSWARGDGQFMHEGAAALGRDARRDVLVRQYVDGCGYKHCQINEYWAEEVRLLPCFDGVCWNKNDLVTAASGSNYAERVLHDVPLPGSSSGQKVIFHLWKGYCNKFGFNNNYPGGAGAEIGIYLHRSEAWIALNSAENLKKDDILWRSGAGWAALGITSGSRTSEEKWFPAPELNAKIKFELVDPGNDDAVVASADQMAGKYWCTDWMVKESYDEYSKTRPAYIEAGVPEIDPVELTLRWWVNGTKMPDWVYEPRDKTCHINRGYGP